MIRQSLDSHSRFKPTSSNCSAMQSSVNSKHKNSMQINPSTAFNTIANGSDVYDSNRKKNLPVAHGINNISRQ